MVISTAEPRDLLISLVSMNNRELLRRCLDTVALACGELSYDVSVIDNDSDDGSVPMLERDYPEVRVSVNARRLGFSANHNQNLVAAMRSRSHRYVCILNEDTEFEENALQELVAACSTDPRIGVAGPRIHGRDGRRQPSLFRFPSLAGELLQIVARRDSEVTSDGWLNGSCMVMSVATLAAIGPLDERFFLFFEDTDLSRRLADRGLGATVVAAARMLHHGHSTVASPRYGSTSERQMLRSRYLYYHKHHGRLQAALAIALVKADHVARMAKARLLMLTGRREEREKLAVLASLVRYDPRRPLAYEVRRSAACQRPTSGGGGPPARSETP